MTGLQILAAWLYVGAAVLPGAALVRRVLPGLAPLARWPVAAALGSLVQGLAAFVAVAAGLHGPILLLAALSPVALALDGATRRFLVRGLKGSWRVLRQFRRAGAVVSVLAGLGGVTLLALVASCGCPITAADAVNYHLPMLAQFAAGRLAPVPSAFQTAGPALAHVILAPLFGVAGDVAAQSMVPVWALLAAWGLLALARSQRMGGAASVLGTALGSMGLMNAIQSTGFFVENFCMVLTNAALLVGLRGRARPGLVGLLCGALYSVKYTAGATVVAVLVAVALARRRHPQLLRHAGVALVCAALAYLPWALRGLWFVGDPNYPLFNPDAPLMYFGRAGMEHQAEMAANFLTGTRHRELTPLHPLVVPLVTALHMGQGHWLGPAFLVGLLLVLGSQRLRRRHGAVLGGYYVGGLPWHAVSPQPRLFSSMFAVVQLTVADGILRLWTLRADLAPWQRHGQRALVALMVAGQLGAGTAGVLLRARQGLVYALGLQDRDAFLAQRAAFFAVHHHFAALLAGEAGPVRVLLPSTPTTRRSPTFPPW